MRHKSNYWKRLKLCEYWPLHFVIFPNATQQFGYPVVLFVSYIFLYDSCFCSQVLCGRIIYSRDRTINKRLFCVKTTRRMLFVIFLLLFGEITFNGLTHVRSNYWFSPVIQRYTGKLFVNWLVQPLNSVCTLLRQAYTSFQSSTEIERTSSTVSAN